MNERIYELARQAGFHIAPYDGINDNGMIKKFAELIVRECAGVCESMPLLGSYKEVQDATLKDAAVQIREHFGVEE